MRKLGLCAGIAAGAICMTPAAYAQVPVELEGEFSDYDHSNRTMSVMDIPVVVSGATVMESPTVERRDIGYGINKWFKSDKLPGRRERGFLGGTAIVIGTWNDALGVIEADSVFTEPAENVVIGVITSNSCTAVDCRGTIEDPANPGEQIPADFIRGSNGPALIPVTDPRMAAGAIVDEGGFDVDLTDQDLIGVPFATEGYYSDREVDVPDGAGGFTSERAIHYFHMELGGFTPELLLNNEAREVSALRVDCRVGDELEVRGNVHVIVDALGAIVDPDGGPQTGIIQANFDLGAPLAATSAITEVDVGSAFGEYRIRAPLPTCPAEIDIVWQDVPGANPGTVYAQLTGVPVDIRLD